MASGGKRAHGVTPGLREDYRTRTAEKQGAFVLPYLQPGMNVLDVGCGPGSITLGLAQAVAPGQVTGIDHDPEHVEMARSLAVERGVDNVTFQTGDVLPLPWEDGRFDAAFENDVFTHLSQDAVWAAREVYRVLKPGGLFLLNGPFGRAIVQNGWGDAATVEELKERIRAWGEHPDAFFANVHVEVVGWK